MPVTVVIFSTKNSERTDLLNGMFPDALWSVPRSEEDNYAPMRTLANPESGNGLKRQWILDHVPGPVFLVDDDVVGLRTLANPMEIEDAEDIAQVIENAAEIAAASGAPAFGFAQAREKYNPLDPFGFTGSLSGAYGVISRDVRFDVNLNSQAEVEYYLRCMLQKRIIFFDRRFEFTRQKLAGLGYAEFERRQEITGLADRWGKWVTYRKLKSSWRITPQVKRRQAR